MKHTFLIIAHNEFLVLQTLVNTLDYNSNDIVIHIDKKVKTIPEISSKKAKLYMIPNRINVRWGHMSQINTELILMRFAYQIYDKDDLKDRYFHIISGTTLPLKPFKDIDKYYNILYPKVIYSHVSNDDFQVDMKLHRYNFFLYCFQSKNLVLRFFSQKLWHLAILLQRKLNIHRNVDLKFICGSNWISMPSFIVDYLLKQQTNIKKIYRWSFCGDEFFIPSTLSNSRYSMLLEEREDYLLTFFNGRPNPKILGLEDIPDIIASGCIWARKISDASKTLIDYILNRYYAK